MTHHNEGVYYESLTYELFCDDNPSPTVETHKLAVPCNTGEIDWFISHSWHDDAKGKWKVLQEEAEAFRQLKGRWPVLWLDKVCIDQQNIQQSLKCLPVYLMACNAMLVLGGKTYVGSITLIIIREGGEGRPRTRTPTCAHMYTPSPQDVLLHF